MQMKSLCPEKSYDDSKMRIYIESVMIILMVTIIGISESFSEFCPEGEEFSLCGNNDCQPTCRFPRGPKNCTDKCRPGCICYKTLVRREKDKKCIPLEECRYNCQPGKPPSQPCKPTVPPRRPQGPPRRRQGPPSRPQGPPSRPQGPPSRQESFSEFCPEGEEFSLCGKNDCQPTCRFPRGPKNCTEKCRPGCICYKTLVRREKDQKCVTFGECRYNEKPGKRSCQPSRPTVPPDGPTSRPQRPPSRPPGPTSRPQRPTSRPQRPTSRSHVPPSRPQGPTRRPQGPPCRPQAPSNRPQCPPSSEEGLTSRLEGRKSGRRCHTSRLGCPPRKNKHPKSPASL